MRGKKVSQRVATNFIQHITMSSSTILIEETIKPITYEKMAPISLVHQSKNPSLVLKEKSLMFGHAIDSIEFAQKLDEDDKLATFRNLFTIPLKKDLPHGKFVIEL